MSRRQRRTTLDARRFATRLLLWLVPVSVVWVLLTPFYNQFLTTAVENLVRLTERPAVTRLVVQDTHYTLITRSDFSASQGKAGSFRMTDIHFHLLLLGAFFLAVPGLALKTRFSNLGWALLASIFFHLVLSLFWVKFTYATQLGEWSGANYGGFGQIFWGLGKHLLDIPFKFAWPLLLWCAFYLRLLLPERSAETG